MTPRLSRLALILAVLLLAALAAGIAATWRAASEEFTGILDDDLENQTTLLARLLDADEAPPSRPALEHLLRQAFDAEDEDALWVTVHDLRSGVVASNRAEAFPLVDAGAEEIATRRQGVGWHGHQQRKGRLVVQMLRRDDLHGEVRDEVLEDIVLPAVAGSVVALALLGLFLFFAVRPLTRLSRQLAERDPSALTPLALPLAPREIADLRDAINHLFERVDDVLARERRFASDVAHELRTPLTTLRLALADEQPDLPLLRGETVRMTRVVEQLLVLARLEQGHWRQRFLATDLAQVGRDAFASWQPRARAQGLSLRAELPDAAVMVRGDATLLRILIDNLIGNAVRYCPAGADILLSLSARALRVSDTGPGIPEAARARMMARFERLDRKSDGLGLGLAICVQIAEVHGARLSLSARADGASGLVAGLILPGPEAS